MSISVSINPSIQDKPKPTVVRSMTIIIYTGSAKKVTDENGDESIQYSNPPYVEIVAQPADPIKDKNGNPMTTPGFNEPAYEDRSDYTPKSIRITDPNVLLPFIASVFDPMMAGADENVKAQIAQLFPDLVPST